MNMVLMKATGGGGRLDFIAFIAFIAMSSMGPSNPETNPNYSRPITNKHCAITNEISQTCQLVLLMGKKIVSNMSLELDQSTGRILTAAIAKSRDFLNWPPSATWSRMAWSTWRMVLQATLSRPNCKVINRGSDASSTKDARFTQLANMMIFHAIQESHWTILSSVGGSVMK